MAVTVAQRWLTQRCTTAPWSVCAPGRELFGTASVFDAVSDLERAGSPWTAEIRRIVWRPQDNRTYADVNEFVAEQITNDVMQGKVDIGKADALMFALLRFLATGGTRHAIATLDLYGTACPPAGAPRCGGDDGADGTPAMGSPMRRRCQRSPKQEESPAAGEPPGAPGHCGPRPCTSPMPPGASPRSQVLFARVCWPSIVADVGPRVLDGLRHYDPKG